ncbi:MAG: hypothetical protein ABIW46_00395, partial [Acidimicrobiales bacterium]
MAALGGALVAGALAVVAYDSWSAGASGVVPLVLTGAVLATSLLALAWAGSVTGAVVPAAVASSGVIVPAVAFFTAGFHGEFPSLRSVALLGGLALAALYLVGPAPGHNFHLALLAGAGWLAAVAWSGSGGLLL